MTAETATPVPTAASSTAPSATPPATHTGRDGKGIQVTEPAMKQLGALMNQQGEAKVLRVGVRSGGCSGMSYTMDYAETQTPLESAVLVSTTDTGHTGGRKWIETPATLEQNGDEWNAEAAVPEGTTACYLNVKAGQVLTSSDYIEIK